MLLAAMTNAATPTKPKAYSYIRMSTDVQLKGDSLRRQTAASQQYAADHGLELAPPIEDIGVSGFRGSNREFGNLARFLDQVERGLIERGSYLIVESLDRLSRQNVFEAFSLFGQIVRKGVKIVTLMDGQTYDEASFTDNHGQAFIALGSMLRAPEESRIKSKRIAAAWKQKRAEASTKKLTRTMPAWLRMSADRQTIEALPERVAIVEEIFRLARDGYGAYSIAQRLNHRREPTWSNKAGLWYESYIKKILSNRSVLGEFQPFTTTYEGGSGARRVPDGDPVPSYYPAVIDHNLFLAAQAAISTRKISGRGRKGATLTNLFTGVIKCGHCGRPMRYINKGTAVKGGQYLRCTSSYFRADCKSLPWRYSYFEQSFLQFLRKVDLRYVLGGQKQDELAAQLQQRRLIIEAEIAGISQSIENLVAAIAESAALALSKKVAELEVKAIELEAERTQVSVALNDIEQSRAGMSKEEIEGLLDKITRNGSQDFDDRPRRLLASEINRVIRKIELFSNDSARPWDGEDAAESSRIEAMAPWERQMLNSYYIVHYSTGESEYVRPYEADSLIYPTTTRMRINALRDKSGRFVAQ
ncbi:recombinase family protein [Dokdonella sp.]|uniref:recombinase family protein n=1 Tax=Dokdonella sp. TaxID=2291710 RepID=UPI0025C5058F|nr:recombinase family protein [Dokdonella sp.]